MGSPSHWQGHNKPPLTDQALLGKESMDAQEEGGARQVWNKACMGLKQTKVLEWSHGSPNPGMLLRDAALKLPALINEIFSSLLLLQPAYETLKIPSTCFAV